MLDEFLELNPRACAARQRHRAEQRESSPPLLVGDVQEVDEPPLEERAVLNGVAHDLNIMLGNEHVTVVEKMPRSEHVLVPSG